MTATDSILSRLRATRLSDLAIANVQFSDVAGVIEARAAYSTVTTGFAKIHMGAIESGLTGTHAAAKFWATTFDVDADAAVSLNSTGAAIGIGTNADAFGINIGTGAAARTITMGNGTGATSLVLNAGTGNIDIGANAFARSINIGTAAAVVQTIAIGGTGANVIGLGNTQTLGSISLGAAMLGGTISIGGTGAQVGTIDIAPGTGAQTLNLAAGGTGVKTIHIGDGAVANVVTLGSATGAAQTTIQAGTVGLSMTSTGPADLQAAGAVTIDSSGSTIGIGTDADAFAINIGTGAAARTITIGNTTGASNTIINAGTGASAWNVTGAGTLTLGTGITSGTILIGGTAQAGAITLGSSSATNIVNVGTGTGATTVNIATAAGSAKAVNIGTGAVANAIVIGSTTAGGTTLINSPTTTIAGNLIVNGTTTTVHSQDVTIADRFIYENADNITTAQTAGIVVNYDGSSAQFAAVAGAAFPSTTTVEVVTGSFANSPDADDGAIVQITGATNPANNGLFIIASISVGTGTGGADVLTLQATTATNGWAQTVFVASAAVAGQVTRVSVSVLQAASANGLWAEGQGNTYPLTFATLATTASVTVGADQVVEFAIAGGGGITQLSTNSIPANGTPTRAMVQISTTFTTATTLQIGVNAGTLNKCMDTVDIDITRTGIYEVPNMGTGTWGDLAKVAATFDAAPGAGAGLVRVYYAAPVIG
jgi:hypothetical protein